MKKYYTQFLVRIAPNFHAITLFSYALTLITILCNLGAR